MDSTIAGSVHAGSFVVFNIYIVVL